MKRFLFLFPLFLLISCGSSRIESNFSPVYVTNTSKYYVLPPQAMTSSVDSAQRMTARFGEGKKASEFEFDVYVIADSSQLSMTIFNELGTTMASLFYDGENLDFDSVVFPKNLKAEYIVADFQFCLYDVSQLQAALENIGVKLEVSIADGIGGTSTETRILSKKDKVISKITKTYGKNSASGAEELKSIDYENFLRGYSYTLLGVES